MKNLFRWSQKTLGVLCWAVLNLGLAQAAEPSETLASTASGASAPETLASTASGASAPETLASTASGASAPAQASAKLGPHSLFWGLEAFNSAWDSAKEGISRQQETRMRLGYRLRWQEWRLGLGMSWVGDSLQPGTVALEDKAGQLLSPRYRVWGKSLPGWFAEGLYSGTLPVEDWTWGAGLGMLHFQWEQSRFINRSSRLERDDRTQVQALSLYGIGSVTYQMPLGWSLELSAKMYRGQSEFSEREATKTSAGQSLVAFRSVRSEGLTFGAQVEYRFGEFLF